MTFKKGEEMNKTENAILADSLRKIATALTAIADVLDATAKGSVKKGKKVEAPENAAPTEDVAAPVPDAKDVPEEAATEEAAPAAVPTYTKEEVRKILAAKAGEDLGPAVKAIIKKHGADNLTGLDPKEYAAVVKEVEALHA